MALVPLWIIFSLLALSGANSDSDSDSDSSDSGESHRYYSRHNDYPPPSTYPQGYPQHIYNNPAYLVHNGPPMYGGWYPPPTGGYGYPQGYPGYVNPPPPSYGLSASFGPQEYRQNLPTYPAAQQPTNGAYGEQQPPSNGYYSSLGPMYYPIPQNPATSKSSSSSNTTVINN